MNFFIELGSNNDHCQKNQYELPHPLGGKRSIMRGAIRVINVGWAIIYVNTSTNIATSSIIKEIHNISLLSALSSSCSQTRNVSMLRTDCLVMTSGILF